MRDQPLMHKIILNKRENVFVFPIISQQIMHAQVVEIIPNARKGHGYPSSI